MIAKMPTQKQITALQDKILSWYKKNKRDLPWRKDRDPYHILISEVMLQQTQVSRVIEKYKAWIIRFPDFATLAEASVRDVLQYWSGLGYNRRALYLQKCAQVIVSDYADKMPQDEKLLLKLPGVGEYTARALLCFAFNQQIAVIDTNIKKVIAVHFFNGTIPEKHILQEVATLLLPQGSAYEWNQALMDFASAEMKQDRIVLPKQSTFKDSDRYYRGQILKLLLSNEKYTLQDFLRVFQQPEERLLKILKTLEKDHFIRKENTYYTLKEIAAK